MKRREKTWRRVFLTNDEDRLRRPARPEMDEVLSFVLKGGPRDDFYVQRNLVVEEGDSPHVVDASTWPAPDARHPTIAIINPRRPVFTSISKAVSTQSNVLE